MTQFLNRKAGQARTTDPIDAPVTVQELVDWLVLPDAEPMIGALIDAAANAVIRHIGYDLVARDWTLTHWDWPNSGTFTHPTLSGQAGEYLREIRLPYANLLAVTSVESYGEQVTGFIPRPSAGSVVMPLSVPVLRTGNNADPALLIHYRAGFGESAADVPDAIKQAVLQLAAFSYEHRGACDANQALARSGAKELLAAYVSPENLVLY